MDHTAFFGMKRIGGLIMAAQSHALGITRLDRTTWEALATQYPQTVDGLRRLLADHPEFGATMTDRGAIYLDGRCLDTITSS